MADNKTKYKYLAKNVGVLTIGSFATKILSFFLVPLYTNVLTTTEYGINDTLSTTIGILMPILTINIQDSVMRYTLEKEYDRKSVLSIGLKYHFGGTFILLIPLVLNYTFGFNNIFRIYAPFFFLMYFSSSLLGILISYTKGIDRVKDLTISSIINSALIISCNIIFLLVFKWGLVGYLMANIIGCFAQCFYIIIKADIIKNIDFKTNDSVLLKEMTLYSKPLIANAIGWWIINASDRYVVIYFCGLSINGIYAVAAKIPSVLNIFQNIFSQAWSLSVIKDYDPKDKDGFFANTYKMYNCLMTVGCSMLIVINKFLAKILYAKDFYVAWKYVPWLTIALIFGALSGYIGGFFATVKNSKIFAQSTLIGAVFNMALNIIFTPKIGAMGAAVATTISFIVVWGFRYVHSRKYITLKIQLSKHIFSYCILLLQAVFMLVYDGIFMYGIEMALFIIIILLYIKDIIILSNRIIDVLLRRVKKLSE